MVMSRTKTVFGRKTKAWKPKELSRFKKWRINKIVNWNMRHGRSNVRGDILEPVQTIGIGYQSRPIPKDPPKRIKLSNDSKLFI